MNKVEITIQEIMAAVFEKELGSISYESSQDNIENWDSLKHFDLIVSLEEEFDIVFPVEEIGSMVSFNLIKVIIEEQLKMK
jgi:acyl carrier protein